MRLYVRQPMLAQLDCTECQRHVYKIPWGVPDYDERPDGTLNLIERPVGAEPPCHECPKSVKGGPDYDGLYSISNENAMLLEICKRADSPGYVLPDHLQNDPLFAERYAIVMKIIHDGERAIDNDNLASELARLIMGRR